MGSDDGSSVYHTMDKVASLRNIGCLVKDGRFFLIKYDIVVT